VLRHGVRADPSAALDAVEARAFPGGLTWINNTPARWWYKNIDADTRFCEVSTRRGAHSEARIELKGQDSMPVGLAPPLDGVETWLPSSC
jgi:hypothetical protein